MCCFIGIFSSIVGGAFFITKEPAVAILIIIYGSIVSFISIAFTMMISEISILLSEIKEELYQIRLSSNGTVKDVPIDYANIKDGIWKCAECGNINSSKTTVCKKCGHEK